MLSMIINNENPLTDEELQLLKEAALYFDGELGSGEISALEEKLITQDMVICTPNPFADGYDFRLNKTAIEFLVNMETFKEI